MPGAAAIIGRFATAIEIASFFTGQNDEDAQRAQISTLQGSVDQLEVDLSSQIAITNMSDAFALAQTAYSSMIAYGNAEDAGVRAGLASSARRDADLALNRLVDDVKQVIGSEPAESLAYGFGALQYAILVRQAVANTIQDGPLGEEGLHAKIKEATALLYNSAGTPSIVGDLERALNERIEARDVEQGNILAEIRSKFESTFSGRTETISTTRESYPGRFWFLPDRLEDSEDWFERHFDRVQDAIEDTVNEDEAEMGASEMRTIGTSMAQHLAASPDAATAQHDFQGSAGGDVETGTDLADYLSGVGGDDILSGGAAPDSMSGGSGNDIMRGGTGQDFMRGGTGNDMLFGNETYDDAVGGDTVRLAGLSSEYGISGGQTYAVVSGPDGGKDKLFNIEFLRFDDMVLALDEGSHLEGLGSTRDFDVAERVALIYEAALNRDGAIDLPGLNFYIAVTERDNLSDEFLAADMMNSPEFATNFGDPATLSNGQFLERIYLNVLDRDSDEAGRQFYLDLLDAGTISKSDALADIAISPENTEGSTEVLMSLFESSDGLWSFV